MISSPIMRFIVVDIVQPFLYFWVCMVVGTILFCVIAFITINFLFLRKNQFSTEWLLFLGSLGHFFHI